VYWVSGLKGWMKTPQNADFAPRGLAFWSMATGRCAWPFA
jgi:hypothetical protein